jgi:hypothetical protein
MTYPQAMHLIVSPQAFRAMVPRLLTQAIVLFQDTSLGRRLWRVRHEHVTRPLRGLSANLVGLASIEIACPPFEGDADFAFR